MTRRTALLLLVTMNVVWGGTYVAAKLGLDGVGPWTLAWSRYALGALVLLPFAVARYGWPIRGRDLRVVFLIGLGALAFNQGLMIAGLHLAGATDAALLISNEPVFTAIFAWLLLGESFGIRKGAGFIVATAGVALVVTKGNPLQLSWVHVQGDLMILLGVALEASQTVLGKPFVMRYPPVSFTAVVMLAAAIGSAVPAAIEMSHQAPHPTALTFASIVYLGALASGIGYAVWFSVLRHLPASEVAVTVFLQPITGVALAAWLVGERPVLADFVGAALVLLGVGLVTVLGSSQEEVIITPAATAGGNAPE